MRRFARSLVLLIVFAPLLLPQGAVAQSSSSAPVSVTVQDEGKLTVVLGPDPIVFLAEDGGVPGVSSLEGDVAYADVIILITDSRADGARDPYSVGLTMSGFTHERGAGIIGTDRISAINVAGLNGLGTGVSGEAFLSSAVTVVDSGQQPPAGEWAITVTLKMELPAGTVPGNFNGSIQIELVQGIGL